MFEKQMVVYFVVYVVVNLIAIMFSAKLLTGVHVSFFKTLLFSILFTAVQFVLDHFIKINILISNFIRIINGFSLFKHSSLDNFF